MHYYFLYSALVFLLLSTSCNNCPCDQNVQVQQKKELSGINNAKSNTPVVWHHPEADASEHMYWTGNYQTVYDTIMTVDPMTFDETTAVYIRTLRLGKWTLIGRHEGRKKIYAYRTYQNDSLVATEVIHEYPDRYNNMKAMGAFNRSVKYSETVYFHNQLYR